MKTEIEVTAIEREEYTHFLSEFLFLNRPVELSPGSYQSREVVTPCNKSERW
jgi:hypothetical protein